MATQPPTLPVSPAKMQGYLDALREDRKSSGKGKECKRPGGGSYWIPASKECRKGTPGDGKRPEAAPVEKKPRARGGKKAAAGSPAEAPQQGGALARVVQPTEGGQKRKPRNIEEKYASENPSDKDIENYANDYIKREQVKAQREGTVEALIGLKGGYSPNVNPKQFAKIKKEAAAEAKKLSDDDIVKKYSKGSDSQRAASYKYSLNEERNKLSSFDKEEERVKSSKRMSEASREKKLKKIERDRTNARESIKILEQRVKEAEGGDGGAGVKTRLKDARDQALGALRPDQVNRYGPEFAVMQHLEAGKGNTTGYSVSRSAEKATRSKAKRQQQVQERSRQILREHLQEIHRNGSGGDDVRNAANALGLKGEPTRAQLKAAYRRAAAKSHPDGGGSAEKFQRVNKAYETLKRQYNFDSFAAGYMAAFGVESRRNDAIAVTPIGQAVVSASPDDGFVMVNLAQTAPFLLHQDLVGLERQTSGTPQIGMEEGEPRQHYYFHIPELYDSLEVAEAIATTLEAQHGLATVRQVRNTPEKGMRSTAKPVKSFRKDSCGCDSECGCDDCQDRPKKRRSDAFESAYAETFGAKKPMPSAV